MQYIYDLAPSLSLSYTTFLYFFVSLRFVRKTLYITLVAAAADFAFFTLEHNSACNLPMHSGFTIFEQKCTNEGKNHER
jgi:hypothetical protein